MVQKQREYFRHVIPLSLINSLLLHAQTGHTSSYTIIYASSIIVFFCHPALLTRAYVNSHIQSNTKRNDYSRLTYARRQRFANPPKSQKIDFGGVIEREWCFFSSYSRSCSSSSSPLCFSLPHHPCYNSTPHTPLPAHTPNQSASPPLDPAPPPPPVVSPLLGAQLTFATS